MAGAVLDLEPAVAQLEQLAVGEAGGSRCAAEPQPRKLAETLRSAVTMSSGIP